MADGPGESWMRPTVDLVKGESMTPLQRLFAVADDANGIGTKLDIRKWTFLNTDLVVHVHRVPEGEWIGIRAETSYGPDGIGTTFGTLFDETGPVGGIQQSVLVRPRPPRARSRRIPQSSRRSAAAGHCVTACCIRPRSDPAGRASWISTLPSSCTSNTSSAIDSQMPWPVHLARSTLNPHRTTAGSRLTPCTKLLCSRSGSPNSTCFNRVSNSRNKFRSSALRQLVAEAEVRPAATEAEVRVG